MKFLFFILLGVQLFASITFLDAEVEQGESPPKNQHPRVLFLSAYHAAFPTVRYQLEGVFALSDYEAGGVDMDVYLMDTKRYSPEQRAPLIYEDLEQMVEERGGYDLILSADDNALRFLLKHKEVLFGPDVPVVFFGINDYLLGEESAKLPDYTGIIEATSLKETVVTAFDILPDLKHLMVLVDSTPTGEGDVKAFFEQVPQEYLIKCTIENLKDYSFKETARHLDALGEDEAVFLLSAYYDKEGARMSFPRVLKWIGAHTDRPVFHPYRHGVGDGLAGGKVVSHYNMASLAVDYAHRILNGEPVASLPLIRNGGNLYMFDYEQLAAAHADLSRLPKNTVLLNQPVSIWREYREWIVLFSAIGLLVLAFAVTVSVLYLRKRQLLMELQESEERMSQLFANSYAPMVILNLEDDCIVDANPAALQFYQYEREEFLALSLNQVNPEMEETKKKWRDGDHSRHVVQVKHRLSSGEIKEVEVILTELPMRGKPFLFAIVQDRTERMQWERDLLESKEQAEQANKAKDEFLGVMSHELRTPLNPIIGFSGMFLESTEDVGLRNGLRIIHQSAERMLYLVDNILRYIKLRGGSPDPQCSVISVDNLIREAVEEYQALEDGNQVEREETLLGEGLEGGVPDMLADEVILRQILDNLVGNARKFTNNGRVSIGCTIEKDPQRARHLMCRFHVSDDGIGIGEDRLEDLFNPFTQVDSSYTREFEGAGLGLAIVKELVATLDGEVGVSSRVGEGSYFWFAIPLQVVEQSAPQEDVSTAAGSLKFDRTFNVLLVEDNQLNANYVESCMASMGGNVDWAANGIQGIHKADTKVYDAILMDLSMPGMSGFDVIKRIRIHSSENYNTPICVLTAHVDVETRGKCMKLGVQEVLTKPFSIEELHAGLSKVLFTDAL